MKNYQQPGDTQNWYNGTGSTVASGSVVARGGECGIAVTDIAAGAYGAVRFSGVFQNIPAVVGQQFDHGQDLYWDSTLGKATIFRFNATAKLPFLGKAVPGTTVGSVAKAIAGTTCSVEIGKAPGDGRRVLVDEDFVGGGLSEEWKITDSSSSGTPVAAITSAAGGQVELTLASTNEAENVCLSQNDVLAISLTKAPIAEFVATVAALPAAANQIISLGLASARHDTPGAIAEHMLFALSANANLLVQTDDGTLDISDADTGVDIVEGTPVHLAIDARNPAAVRFFVNGVDVTATALAAATGAPTAFKLNTGTPTGLYQVYAQVQKGADTSVPSLKIDRVLVHTAS